MVEQVATLFLLAGSPSPVDTRSTISELGNGNDVDLGISAVYLD